MDSTALTMCMENDLPIIVFDLAGDRSIERAIMREPIGTTVSSHGPVVLDGAVVG
jgi:uridylate kinase